MLLTTKAAVIDIKEENPVGGMSGMIQSNKISFFEDQSVDWSPFMFVEKSVQAYKKYTDIM